MNTKDYVIYGDTDSVVGETLIIVNGESMKIEDFFNICGEDYILQDKFNEDYVKRCKGFITKSYDDKNVIDDNIEYVMKHKVRKKMYKVICNGDSVIVTEDHSIIVERDEKLTDVSPCDIMKGDKIIKIMEYL